MDLRRLSHVVALAANGSFAQAAEAVHLSQPAFSRSIQSLEDELGVELFTRGLRRITPTAYGRLVVERARRMLDEAMGLKRDVKRMRACEFGEVSIGLGPIPAAALLDPILMRTSREHPGIHIHVELSHWRNLLKLLEADELDFFIADIRELVSSENLVVDPLPYFSIGLFCRRNHPVSTLQAVSSAVLLRYCVGSYKLPDISLAEFTQSIAFDGDPEALLAVQCDNMAILERLALHSDLIVMGPQLAFRKAVAERRLVQVALDRPLRMNTHMGVVRMRDRMLAPGAELLIDMALEEMAIRDSEPDLSEIIGSA